MYADWLGSFGAGFVFRPPRALPLRSTFWNSIPHSSARYQSGRWMCLRNNCGSIPLCSTITEIVSIYGSQHLPPDTSCADVDDVRDERLYIDWCVFVQGNMHYHFLGVLCKYSNHLLDAMDCKKGANQHKYPIQCLYRDYNMLHIYMRSAIYSWVHTVSAEPSKLHIFMTSYTACYGMGNEAWSKLCGFLCVLWRWTI